MPGPEGELLTRSCCWWGPAGAADLQAGERAAVDSFGNQHTEKYVGLARVGGLWGQLQ